MRRVGAPRRSRRGPLAAVAVLVAAVAIWIIAGHPGYRSGRPRPKPEQITLAPARVSVGIGDAQNFTATAHYHGGATRNVTQQVQYRSSDTAIARAPNDEGKRSRVEAVAPGTATISATDAESGVDTSQTGGDATLTVLGALERIELTPRTVSRAVGTPQNFTATGFYAGGVTRNLTQHVVYQSSDPSIAITANETESRSRVDTVAPGTATISATDPTTQITTTASGGDAVLTVFAAGAAPAPPPSR